MSNLLGLGKRSGSRLAEVSQEVVPDFVEVEVAVPA
jgi:hypothetical protein